MAIAGSCLCGGVRFEIERAIGPFELCHCNRCRKSSGSAFVAGVGVRVDEYRLLTGRELIASYDAPILERPPAYRVFFCTRCGSMVPEPEPSGEWFEIPAGLLEGDPSVRPDKHIFAELEPAWLEIAARLPRLTKAELIELRLGRRPAPEPPEAWRVAPVLVVRDVGQSIAYYRDTLGFDVIGTFGEPPEVAFVGRAGIQLMLQDAEGKPTPGSNRGYKSVAWDAHVWVEDVESLHADFVARGATIVKPPTATFYGAREIEVADPDGHVLCFGQQMQNS